MTESRVDLQPHDSPVEWPADSATPRTTFYLRDAMLARSLRQRRVRPSVRLSGSPSHAGIVPRRAKAGSWNVHHGKVWVVEKFARVTPKKRAKWGWGTLFRRFSTNVSSYLENGAFYTQSYYRTVIGNFMQAIEWCHFGWPWVTHDPGFKVTVVLKGEYLQSDAFYRHIYYIGR